MIQELMIINQAGIALFYHNFINDENLGDDYRPQRQDYSKIPIIQEPTVEQRATQETTQQPLIERHINHTYLGKLPDGTIIAYLIKPEISEDEAIIILQQSQSNHQYFYLLVHLYQDDLNQIYFLCNGDIAS